jgi:hypothetical protein
VPSSETLTVRPAIEADVERGLPLLAAAVSITVPEPVRPALVTSQEAPLVAVQLQPAVAVTLTCAEPPAAVKDITEGEMA